MVIASWVKNQMKICCGNWFEAAGAVWLNRGKFNLIIIFWFFGSLTQTHQIQIICRMCVLVEFEQHEPHSAWLYATARDSAKRTWRFVRLHIGENSINPSIGGRFTMGINRRRCYRAQDWTLHKFVNSSRHRCPHDRYDPRGSSTNSGSATRCGGHSKKVILIGDEIEDMYIFIKYKKKLR